MGKWTPTIGESAIGVGGVIALVASGAATAATVPAVVVIGGVLYAVRRSGAVQDAAQTNFLLSPMALPGEGAAQRQLPSPDGQQPLWEAPRPKRAGILRGILEMALDESELAELNAVEQRRSPAHQQAEVRQRSQDAPRSLPAASQRPVDDDGLVEDADFEVEDERPALSMKEAMRALPKLVLLGQLQPYPDSPLAVPMGINQHGDPVWGDFGEDLLHVGVYGTSGSGKDQLLRTWFALLAKRNAPEDVQFVFLDGKGDWMTPDLAELKHMWREPAGGYGKEGREAILEALKTVDNEARDRSKLLREAGCRSIEQFNQRHPGEARPLLFVVASDIGDIGGESEEIFTSLTQKARSLGFRIVASMQSPTGKKMDWRLNLSSLLAGSMVDSSQDGPALGIRETSSLAYKPSAIPQPPKVRGVFVVRFRGDVMLVRTPMFKADKYENEDRFDRIVASLPSKRPSKPAERATRRFEAILPDETAGEYEERVARGAAGVVAGAVKAGAKFGDYTYTVEDEELLRRTAPWMFEGGSVKGSVHGSASGSAAGSANKTLDVQTALPPASQALPGAEVAEIRDAKTLVLEYRQLPADVREKVGKTLQLMDQNGGQITPAIREVFGVDGGRAFTRFADAVRLGLAVREAVQAARKG